MTLRIVCTSAQVGSHLGWGGYLATASALQAREHEVIWVSGAAVENAVRDQGLNFVPVGNTGWRWPPPPPLDAATTQKLDANAVQFLRQQRSLDQWLNPELVLDAVAELDTIVQDVQPHVVVGEMFMAAAALVAERHGIPFVVAGWPAPRHAPPVQGPTPPSPILQDAQARLAHLLTATDLHGQNFTQHGPPALCSPHLHLSYWSPAWFGGPKAQDRPVALHGEQTVHVGGVAPAALPPEPTLPAPDARPWVLITLGTTFNQDPAFFRMAAQAADALGALPILALGTPLDTPWVQSVVDALPASAQVRAWVDLATVLPYVVAAIHHGGAGTTHALVTHAVPQIVVPHAADQMRQAHGVARTGVGVAITPQQTSVAALEQLLAQLLPDRAPARTDAASLQAEFAALGGVEAAAGQIEQLVAR